MSKQEIMQEIARLKADLEMYEKWAKQSPYNQAKVFYVPYITGKITQLENELNNMVII